jgi:hypothetical protein
MIKDNEADLFSTAATLFRITVLIAVPRQAGNPVELLVKK